MKKRDIDGKFINTLKDKKCKACSSIFYPKSSFQKYCSLECNYKSKKGIGLGRKSGVYIKCKNCSKELYIYPSRIGNRKYCSKECAKIDDYGFIPKDKNCEWCGNIFTITGSLRTQDKYCSSVCKKEAFHDKQLQRYERLKNTKVKGVCKECGKDFIFSERNIKSYCSKKCVNNHISKDRMGKNNPAYDKGKYLGVKRDRNSLHQYSCLKYKKDFLSKNEYPFCEVCLVNSNGTHRFEVHHIYFASRFPRHPELHNFKNLIHLCIKCHQKFHAGKNYQEEFEKLEKDRGLKELFS